MYQTKNLGLNITEINKDSLQAFNFDTDLGHNFKAIDEKTLSHRNITNCLLEVPQDLKIELIDGVVTLKEGSKIYVPNGPGVFNEVVIAEDISNKTVGEGDILLAVGMNNNLLALKTDGVSVTQRPENPEDFVLYYNTVTNKAEIYDTTWFSDCSFPIAIVERTNNGFTNIKQVFNGFGYIGSTVFALPGVKGLIPDGRNENESLNNRLYTIPSVAIQSYSGISHTSIDLLINELNELNLQFAQYNKNTNELFNSSGTRMGELILAKVSLNAGTITSLTPKLPFHAVDYYDYQTKITELETKIATLQAAVEALQG